MRLHSIAANRRTDTFETFRSSFDDAVSEMVIRVVYVKFQDWFSGEMTAFPVRADDVIAQIYRMVDEDLEETIIDLLTQCGRSLPPRSLQERQAPILTVRDVVLFIESCPLRE
jgi:hypothetical protein